MGMVMPWESSQRSRKISTQDAGPYLSCICRRFVLARRFLWKLFEECKWYNNYVAIISFTIHPEKSVLKPTQNLIHLGLIINSKDMTLKLAGNKKQKTYDVCTKRFEKWKPTVRFAAEVIGNIVASFLAVSQGPLLYRALETDKIVGLKRYRQNYDAGIKLSNEPYSELVWQKHNIKNSF